MINKIQDNFVLIYCFLLFNLAFLFLGFEISTIKNEEKIRHAQKTVEKCQVLITKGDLYEKI